MNESTLPTEFVHPIEKLSLNGNKILLLGFAVTVVILRTNLDERQRPEFDE